MPGKKAKTPRSLILSFIDRQPDTAARALTAMEPAKARALLGDIPARFASRVISRMGPSVACERLAGMPADAAAAVLRGLAYQNAAGLLRLMPADFRETVLAELPRAVRRDLRATLDFPADTVGAHMTPAILTQGADQTVADARELVRQATRAETGCVIVVDDQRRLSGLVDPVLLLRYSGRTPLGEIMDRSVAPLSARARVAAIRPLEAWDRYLSLPVVSRQEHVIGTISRSALREALAVGSAAAARPDHSLPVALADAFVGFLGGLLHFADGRSGGPDIGRRM